MLPRSHYWTRPLLEAGLFLVNFLYRNFLDVLSENYAGTLSVKRPNRQACFVSQLPPNQMDTLPFFLFQGEPPTSLRFAGFVPVICRIKGFMVRPWGFAGIPDAGDIQSSVANVILILL